MPPKRPASKVDKGKDVQPENPSKRKRSSSRLAASDLITIIAGEEQEKFYVHEGILLDTSSQALKTLLDGRWQESEKKTIDWSHTDKETISMVVSWLYTGDYQVKLDPKIADKFDENEHWEYMCRELEHRQDNTGYRYDTDYTFFFSRRSLLSSLDVTIEGDKANKKNVAVEIPVSNSNNVGKRPSMPAYNFKSSRQSRANRPVYLKKPATQERLNATDVLEMYTTFLLANVKIYSFAKIYLLHDLRKLAAYRFLYTLSDIDKDIGNAKAVIPALKYAYANIPDAADRLQEPIRLLLCCFVVLNLRYLNVQSLKSTMPDFSEFCVEMFEMAAGQSIALNVPVLPTCTCTSSSGACIIHGVTGKAVKSHFTSFMCDSCYDNGEDEESDEDDIDDYEPLICTFCSAGAHWGKMTTDPDIII